MMRVLVTFSPQMYREVFALSVHRSRPGIDVRIAPPEALEGEVAGFLPHLLVHDGNAPVPAVALSGVPCRAELSYPNALVVRVTAHGSAEIIEDATTEDLLRIVDRAVACGEAAEILGLSTEAVRKRASRGSLSSERHDGRVVVWVDDDRTGAGHDDPLVDELRRQNDYLRSQLDIRTEELREHRRLLAGLIERVPELEAPDRARDGYERVPEDVGEGEGPGQRQTGTQRLPWWRRWFDR